MQADFGCRYIQRTHTLNNWNRTFRRAMKTPARFVEGAG